MALLHRAIRAWSGPPLVAWDEEESPRSVESFRLRVFYAGLARK